ncbi:MAG TPA: hypothetical protein VKQ28_06675 [Candidatus Acidoferrum sp.]|nr:hypothetical protein [Candidatus Acidoferrum sp.]
MREFLANGWVVGIATSLLAGGALALLSYVLLSRRKKLEYVQRVSMANREVIYAIRPGIAEGHIPTLEILEAMANATARKYGLRRQELLDTGGVADELIKEVMDSSFLSSARQAEYCASLSPLRGRANRDESFSKEAMSFSGNASTVLQSLLAGLVSVFLIYAVQRVVSLALSGKASSDIHSIVLGLTLLIALFTIAVGVYYATMPRKDEKILIIETERLLEELRKKLKRP